MSKLRNLLPGPDAILLVIALFGALTVHAHTNDLATALLSGLAIFAALAAIYAVLTRFTGLPRLKVQDLAADFVTWLVSWS